MSLLLWHLQTVGWVGGWVALLLYGVWGLNASVGGVGGWEGVERSTWVWVMGGGWLVCQAVVEGRGASREVGGWVEEEEGGWVEEEERRGWRTDGPRREEGLKMEGVWVGGGGDGGGGGGGGGGGYVLKDVSLWARPGQVLVVCGEEGSGKSVLLRTLAGGGGGGGGGMRGQFSFQGR